MSTIDLLQQVQAADHTAQYDLAVNLGVSVADDLDAKRWVLGDIAASLETTYGKGVIEKFAIDTHNGKSTVQEYRTMSQYYPTEYRDIAPCLRYSHYKKAKVLKDVELSIEILHQAADNLWTVEQLQLAIKAQTETPQKRVKVGEIKGHVQNMGDNALTLACTLEGAKIANNEQLQEGVQYVITIHRVEEVEFTP